MEDIRHDHVLGSGISPSSVSSEDESDRQPLPQRHSNVMTDAEDIQRTDFGPADVDKDVVLNIEYLHVGVLKVSKEGEEPATHSDTFWRLIDVPQAESIE